MGNTYKYGEPSKNINIRVPTSRFQEFRAVAQKAVDNYWFNNKEEKDPSEVPEAFKRLYEIMAIWLLGKMTQKQKEQIPDSVLKEIEEIEVTINV